MGGLATVVAAAIIALAFMQIFTTYYSTSINSSNTLLSAIQQQSSLQQTKLGERISIGSFNVPSSNTFSFPATNTGQISIPANRFGQMDIILEYTASANSTKVVIRLPYNTSATAANGWRVTSVTTNTGNKEIVNPINTPSCTSGMWDPTEIITISVWVSTTNGYLKNQGIAVSLTTPDGVSTIGTY